MALRKSQKTRLNPPRFPYEIIWEELGDRWVTFEELAPGAADYVHLMELSERLGLKTSAPHRADFEALIAGLGLSSSRASQLLDDALLVAIWYLTPRHGTDTSLDLDSTREDLEQIARKAEELHSLLADTNTRVMEVMNYVRAFEPGAFDDASRFDFDDLGRELHDLSLVAKRLFEDTAPTQRGRKREYIRDTAIRLAIDAAKRAGLDDLSVSRGTNEDRPHGAIGNKPPITLVNPGGAPSPSP